jgi:hypothetical protein
MPLTRCLYPPGPRAARTRRRRSRLDLGDFRACGQWPAPCLHTRSAPPITQTGVACSNAQFCSASRSVGAFTRALGLPAADCGEHDVAAARQRPEPRRQRVPGLAAHDDRVPPVVSALKCAMSSGSRQGMRLSLPITPLAGPAPRSGGAAWGHTATGALMAPWHW